MLIPTGIFNPDLTIGSLGKNSLRKNSYRKIEFIKDAGHFVHMKSQRK